MPLLVVTRPQPDAALWTQQLQDQGLNACALPMMEIGPSRSAEAQASVHTALQQLPHYRALMFVSGNAVRHFFALLRSHALTAPAAALYWSPGPGTSQALLSEGIQAQSIIQPASNASQFDSESLWEQAQHHIQAGDHVLIVRGGDGQQAAGQGRQWLTEQLQQCGVQVAFAAVYERLPPEVTPAFLERITTLRNQNALWLLSSSECMQHLVRCNSAWSWHSHTALATHPRIAQQARQAGFGRVIETLPTVQGIAASIKSLHDHL